MVSRKHLLKQYLNWFWLRPETAMLVALRADAYQKTFKYFDEKSLDVSCGDGVFSFIACGGEISKEQDMYQSLDLTKERKGDFDVYDHYDNSYYLKTVKDPKYFYNYGSDWKKNLINKSKKLNFYKNFILHDNNLTMPLENEKFKYIYSNASYWVDNFESHLYDLVRLLKPGGHLVLEMKTTSIEKYSSFNYAKSIMGKEFCQIVDAGRRNTWKGLKSSTELDNIINKIPDVEVITKESLYGDIMAYIWDIGLRPLFRPIAKLVTNANLDIRNEVKEEWCNTVFNLTAEFVNNYQANEQESIEWLYVLKKV